MQKQTTTVNRKWIHRAFKSASRQGTYFTGSTPRDVAHSMVQAHGMHPAFVGKLDQLITLLLKEGTYLITDGRLVRSDNVAQPAVISNKRRIRHQVALRAAQQTRQRERALNSRWHAELAEALG